MLRAGLAGEGVPDQVSFAILGSVSMPSVDANNLPVSDTDRMVGLAVDSDIQLNITTGGIDALNSSTQYQADFGPFGAALMRDADANIIGGGFSPIGPGYGARAGNQDVAYEARWHRR